MDNDLATEALATIKSLERKIAALEKKLHKNERTGAGNAWDEEPLGLFKASNPNRQVGPPNQGQHGTTRHEIGPVKKDAPRGKGIDGLSKQDVRRIDKRIARDRERVEKGTKAVPSIGEGLASGRRMRGR